MNRPALLLLAAIYAPFSGAQETLDHRFEAGHLTVTVTGEDSEYAETRSYQVVVSNELRVLSRLDVNRDGLVTGAWMADLDRDGAFEVIVATGQLDGEDRGAVDIHEWRDFRFDSTAAAALPPAAQRRYRGNDQFDVENGRLRRAFPAFNGENSGDQGVPTGELVLFEYDYPANRWIGVSP